MDDIHTHVYTYKKPKFKSQYSTLKFLCSNSSYLEYNIIIPPNYLLVPGYSQTQKRIEKFFSSANFAGNEASSAYLGLTPETSHNNYLLNDFNRLPLQP